MAGGRSTFNWDAAYLTKVGSNRLYLPRDLLGALDIPESQPEKRIKELIAVALFRDGRISSGKGTELLSITKLDFILLLSQYGVTYFTDSPDELVSEVASIERLLKKTNS